MARCVNFNTQWLIVDPSLPATASPDQCQFLVLTGKEYMELKTIAIGQFFDMPDTSVLTQAFGFGIGTPLTVYLVAYMVGTLVNFWNR